MAGLGQPYRVAFADKQLVTQKLLERPNALADRALCQVQFDCGPAEAEVAGSSVSSPILASSDFTSIAGVAGVPPPRTAMANGGRT